MALLAIDTDIFGTIADNLRYGALRIQLFAQLIKIRDLQVRALLYRAG